MQAVQPKAYGVPAHAHKKETPLRTRNRSNFLEKTLINRSGYDFSSLPHKADAVDEQQKTNCPTYPANTRRHLVLKGPVGEKSGQQNRRDDKN
jgi:hypothetical protein